jgi:hypothetical protein
MRVLFACTTLNRDSTLVEQFNYIEEIMSPYVKKGKKEAVLLYKPPAYTIMNFTWYGKELLEQNGYTVESDPVIQEDLHAFLEHSKPFDAIVFTQCSSLVHTFIGENEKNVSLESVYTSFMNFYDTIRMGGYVFNFYYDTKGMIDIQDVESFISMTTFNVPYQHIFLLMCFFTYFEKVASGVYKKRSNIHLEESPLVLFEERMDTLQKGKTTEEFANALYDTYIRVFDMSGTDPVLAIKKIVRAIKVKNF